MEKEIICGRPRAMTGNGKNTCYMKTFDQPKNDQELWVPRSMAGAGGTFKTAEAEKGCTTEKTKKESTNAKMDKFMNYKYFQAQFQLNAFVFKIWSTEVQSRTVLGREIFSLYIKFLCILEEKRKVIKKKAETLLWNSRQCRLFHVL